MANALYPLARASFLAGNPIIDWDTDDIKVVLVRGYTYSTAHQYYTDIAVGGGTVAATSGNLAGKTATDGIADATDITFTAVPGGAACQSLIIFKDTGVAATSPLVAYIDTATGLPVTPNGGDITVNWDAGANKIFKL